MDSVPRHFLNQIFIGQIDSSTLSVMIVLLFLGAIFSAGEAAFFSLTKPQLGLLEKSKILRDRYISNLLNKPNKERASRRLMATILTARSFSNVLLIFLTTGFFSFELENRWLNLFLVLVFASLLLILVTEVIPKTLATRNNLATARLVVIPMRFAEILLRPLTWILGVIAYSLEKVIKQQSSSNISMDELSHALALTSDDNLSEEENKILEGIVTFGGKVAGQIMTSRVDVAFIYESDKFEDVIASVNEYGYSRLPVAKESPDHVTGVLVVKDLLAHINETDFSWHTLLKQPFFVPENKKIDDLLQEFRYSKTHIAIVVDEYGGTSGIVTMEDILEEIVGEISDEFDEEELQYSKLDNRTYVMEGKIAIVDFYKVLEIDDPFFDKAKGDSSTLAGFVIEQAGYIPEKGDEITFAGYSFIIEAADKRKIKRIKIILPEENKLAK